MELLVVITVIGAFASIALPATDNFMTGQLLTAEGGTFLADLRSARYQAIDSGFVHRVVLTNLQGANIYRVERFFQAFNDPVTTAEIANAANWSSALDSEERELSVDLTITPDSAATIYVMPDGKLADSWSPGEIGLPIIPRVFDFAYGDVHMKIKLGGFGVFSSEARYE